MLRLSGFACPLHVFMFNKKSSNTTVGLRRPWRPPARPSRPCQGRPHPTTQTIKSSWEFQQRPSEVHLYLCRFGLCAWDFESLFTLERTEIGETRYWCKGALQIRALSWNHRSWMSRYFWHKHHPARQEVTWMGSRSSKNSWHFFPIAGAIANSRCRHQSIKVKHTTRF